MSLDQQFSTATKFEDQLVALIAEGMSPEFIREAVDNALERAAEMKAHNDARNSL